MQFTLADSARLIDASNNFTLDSAAIQRRVKQWQTLLLGYEGCRVVLTADSGINWILVDLACLTAGILLTPLPTYLSEAQRSAVLTKLQPNLWLSDVEITDVACTLLEEFDGLLLYRREVNSNVMVAAGTQKITFTSGSTGDPKGVCLSARSQLDVALALKARVEHISESSARHLCLLPLPTLLENIAGVYAPLLAGGDVIVAPDALRGFSGSRLTAPQRLLQLISAQQPKSLILVPELLKMLIQAASQGWTVPTSLEFIAVGGAYVSPALMKKAASLGLPVYQGYGLSECGSVVALSDTPPKYATESVGQPLACRDVQIINGELVVNTPFLGYLGEAHSATQQVYTGDLAEWTAHGALRILGRRKNMLINSFGRNISPEWVETALTDSGVVQQAMLLGDAQPYCGALLFAPAEVSDIKLDEVVAKVNLQLPDYARVVSYHRLAAPFSVQHSTLTDNGRLRRSRIEQCYAPQISALFTGDKYELLSIPA
ncbi:AMP-binding protein [Rheinheimera baltica]|uniref:AMP-binding protein n=1 Tax=Rheinheimera baltica TaxID=67576 RepID=UPI00273DFBEA|nr:AMP-binding protein [Rheinheimera baltica]MDP5190394.1 AMP-binding protein [Rheinheimera baltica]